MAKLKHFSPGQTIVLREVVHNKLWSAKPVIVVQDMPELLVFYAPPATMAKKPKTPAGSRVKAANRVNDDWILIDSPWTDYDLLRMTIPGSIYSVLAFWDSPGMRFHDWYINMEDPLRRTGFGFDYLDQWLDAIVAPDLSAWHWKDEDEFAEAIDAGLISKDKSVVIRTEAERVVKWIQSGKSPFNSWEKWRPDPSWQIPVLPDGWDVL
ncbi:MAG: DUF402 domain-containing protein [Dehalococcoidales bacterium]|nr:DUF402 domain-containing protein [Dehalococcoidales bacterium]